MPLLNYTTTVPVNRTLAQVQGLLVEAGLVEFEGGACEHESATGVDQDFGPDKVWRCDGCGVLYRTVTKDGITHEVPASQEPRAEGTRRE